jgi:hypothetical protein
MKSILFFCLAFLSFFTPLYAQTGNEWIDFTQPYFKITLAKDGLYRLTYADLVAAGFPVTGINPKTIQLYHRGAEQALWVEGQDDFRFDPSDYLEFFGRKNDGTSDTELYKPASLQPHTYYNLFTDTAAYFLTIGSAPGKRMPVYTEAPGGLPAETHHLDEKILVLTDQYAYGRSFNSELYSSAFDEGEGWTGVERGKGSSITYTLTGITNSVPSAGLPVLEVLLAGRGQMEHKAELRVGNSRLIHTASFSGFATAKINQEIAWSDIAGDGSLSVTLQVIGVTNADRISVSYIKLTYPQATNAVNAPEKVFHLVARNIGKSLLAIQHPAPNTRLFDITDPNNVVQIGSTLVSSERHAVVPATSVPRKVYATNTTLTPVVKQVHFSAITPGETDYIIITHPLLRKPAAGYADPVAEYAAYRSSAAGGGYRPLVANIQDIYNQFNYGEPSPLAIFRFMRYLARTHPPKYLFLVGKGLEVTYRYYRDPSASTWVYKDLVPTSGVPGSDAFYTMGLNGTTHEPAIPTGRLTAMIPEQVASYLNKVKEMEQTPYDALWRKNILHLSGGVEQTEFATFKRFLDEFKVTAEDHYLGGKVFSKSKTSRDIQVINIAEQVNQGVNLVTFFGHSSPSTLDFDIGFVTDPVMGYNNPGKYPILLMNGCQAGAFFLYDQLFGEDWVFAEKKGATGFIAHSSLGLASTLRRYSELLYQVGYGDPEFVHKGIGDIQRETAKRYMANAVSSIPNLSQVQQMILLGDPAVKLFGAPKPDYEIHADNLIIESFDGSALTALSDSIALRFIVRNFGLAKPGTFRVEVTRTLNDQSVRIYDSLYAATKYADTLTFVIRKGNEQGFGNNSFRITIDPDDIVDELSKLNNSAVKSVFLPLNSSRNLFPVNYSARRCAGR